MDKAFVSTDGVAKARIRLKTRQQNKAEVHSKRLSKLGGGSSAADTVASFFEERCIKTLFWTFSSFGKSMQGLS